MKYALPEETLVHTLLLIWQDWTKQQQFLQSAQETHMLPYHLETLLGATVALRHLRKCLTIASCTASRKLR